MQELPEEQKENKLHQEDSHHSSPESEVAQFNKPSKEEEIDGDISNDRNQSEESSDSSSKGDHSDGEDLDHSFEDKTEDAKAPTKIGDEKKPASGFRFVSLLGVGLAALFAFFILLMVFMVAQGGESSPILAAFGLDPSGIKSFLLTVVNGSFGFLSVLFFVIGLIGVFKGFFVKKDDKLGRRRAIWLTVLGIVPLIVFLVIWFYLINIINRIQVNIEQVKAEIVLIEPTDLASQQAPLQVTFSSANVIKSLQNKNLNIKSLSWDLNGDGDFETPATDFEITYLYQNKGNYRIGLSVNIDGEAEPRVYYYPLSIESAAFQATPDKGSPPLRVSFDAQGLIPRDRGVGSLDWDFDGDGVYDLSGRNEFSPNFTYEQIGTYRAHLRFVDQGNLVENYYRDIVVEKGSTPNINAVIQVSPSNKGIAPFSVRFDGQESSSLKGKITSYEWDFGDGSSLESGRTVNHVYEKAGVYTVSLLVSDDVGLESTSTIEITVSGASALPEAVIKTNPADFAGKLKGEIPFKISFDASQSSDDDGDIVSYDWDFGDDNEGVGEKVEHIYEEMGIYEATLKVEDAEGQTDEAKVSVEVVEPSLRAVILADPEEGTAPLTIRFDGSSSSAFNGKIVTYEWDFGDGSPVSITGARISHRYEKVGSYEVRLKVTTNENESASIAKTVFVREVPLRACFAPSRNKGKAPLSITLDPACSTGGVKTYQWNFGDGVTSESRKPAHTFNDAGSYNVTLEVFDDKNNVSTFEQEIMVEEK